MTPDQVAQLLNLLEKIAGRSFTITQASDWPLFVFLSAIGFALLGLMWRDLGQKLTSGMAAADRSMDAHKADNVREYDKIWSALRDCQEDCCITKIPHKGNNRREDGGK